MLVIFFSLYNKKGKLKNYNYEKYPQKEQVTEIDNAYSEELAGELVLENFPNLQKISFSTNKKVTGLSVNPGGKKLSLRFIQ